MTDLRLDRTFAVTPDALFGWVTEPGRLARWWGPEGMTLGDCDLDLTRLGPYHFTLIDPSGGAHRAHGQVRAVNPPRSVTFSLYVPNPIGNPIDSVVRFEVHADAAGSRLVLIQSGLTSEQMADASSKGWVSTLGRLAALLTSLTPNDT